MLRLDSWHHRQASFIHTMHQLLNCAWPLCRLEANFLLQLGLFKVIGFSRIFRGISNLLKLSIMLFLLQFLETGVFWCWINPASPRFLFECLCTSFTCQSLSWCQNQIFEKIIDSSRLRDSNLLFRKDSQVKTILPDVCFLARQQQIGNLSK